MHLGRSNMALRILIKIIALVVVVLAVPMHRAMGQRQVKSLREFSGSALTLRDSVVALARAQVGRRYVIGGASPKAGFDCSGLVKYVLRSLDIELPRTARAQAKSGWAVARDPRVLRPGDLLLFGKKQDGISHVGIYVGNGRYVHASSVAGRVIESPLYHPASSMIKVLKSARRVLAFTDSVPVMFNTRVSAALSSSITTLSARLP
jgi:cell wall-associated NlpC family hydrolase